MSQITRLFASHSQAEAAVAELKAYSYQGVRVISPPHPETTAESELTEHDHVAQIEQALHRAGISRSDAAVYAPRIHAGATIVTLQAPFGGGSQAEVLMDEHDPIDSGLHHSNPYDPDYAGPLEDNAAPLSNALGWKLLINDATPLSRLLGLPVLRKKQNSSTTLSNNAAPLSSALHIPLLSSKSAPLSGAFGLPTLSSNPAPFSKALGLRVLISEPAPLSKAIGLKILSSEPAPLSKALGLPLLSDNDQ